MRRWFEESFPLLELNNKISFPIKTTEIEEISAFADAADNRYGQLTH